MGYDDIDFELDLDLNLDLDAHHLLGAEVAHPPHPEDALLQALAAAMDRAGLSVPARAALHEAVTEAFELIGDVEDGWHTLPALRWRRRELARACDRRSLPPTQHQALATLFFECLAETGRLTPTRPARSAARTPRNESVAVAA
jgi:hypothetical protein